MAEIDPVILEIRAEMGRYKAELKSTTSLAAAAFGRQEQQVRSLERQIRASSANIASTLKGLAGSLAGAISAQQLAGLIDGYTRFQNQLRVAGLEGDKLAVTQERLFAIAQKYGVELEAIGTLYGRSAASAKELGLNQQQQATITEATAAALKITGASAESASGALLQLSQALGGSKIQAEEYNSLIDSLRPLLQAVAAGSDKWGGSVAKLTADVKAAKVTTQEFVQALLKGAPQVIEQASEATLTLSGAFTKLTNALTVYIGQSAQANGVTGAIASGMELLASNLDTVADALSVIAAIMLGRFAAGMLAGAASTGLASTAIFALQARAVGAATTMEALALVSATAGRAMLAAFGGPVGLAVAALAIGIAVLSERNDEAAQAARVNAKAQEILGDSSRKSADAIDKLANAHGKAREEARKEAQQIFELTKARLKDAQAALLQATAEYARAKANAAANSMAARQGGRAANQGGFYAVDNQGDAAVQSAMENVRAQETAVGSLMSQIAKLGAALKAPESAISSAAGSGSKKKRVRHGKTPAEIEADVAEKLGRLYEEQLRSQLDITTDADKRAELQGELYELEYKNRIAEINATKEYSDAQKERLREAVRAIYGRDANGNLTSASPQGISINRDLERTQQAQAERLLQIQGDALSAEAQLVDSRVDRLAIERRILALAQQEEEARLEAAIKAGDIADATAARAALAQKQAAERSGLDRQFESPLDAKLRQLNKTSGQISDQVESLVVDELEEVQKGISSAIASKLGVKDPLLAGLINLFVEQNIIKPIANAFRSSGSGNNILSAIASLFGGGGGTAASKSGLASVGSAVAMFGRASGGYVGPGSIHPVNEGSGRTELLRVGSTGAKVIPLGQAAAARPGGGTIKIELHAEEGALFRPVVRHIATQAAIPVAVQVVDAKAPAIAQGGAQLAAAQTAKERRYGTGR